MFNNARALSVLVFALATFIPPFTALPAEAAESASASFRNTRSSVNQGGRRKTSASYRDDSTVGEPAKTTRTSTNFTARDGMQSVYHYPFGVTDLFASSSAVSTQIYLQWTSPGNDGSEASTPGLYLVRYSSIAADSPAISDAKFNAATPVVPAPPAAQPKGTLVSMNVTGLTAGVTYYFAIKTAERDGTRSRLSAGATVQTLAPLGCVVTRNVHKVDGPHTTIQSAVDSLPQSLAGHTCVIVRDGATYAEQVSVRNFVNNGSSITIAADPASGLRPVVSPPASSTAAFQIANTSVNVLGLDIVAAQNVPFGIDASSGYVTISSVSVSTSGSLGIYTAGVRISSWSAVSYSTITVWNAHGVHVFSPGGGSTVTRSSATTRHPGFNALFIEGSDGNVVTGSYFRNQSGRGGYLSSGSDDNVISQSTIVASGVGVELVDSDSNTFTGGWIQAGTVGAQLTASDANVIAASTVTAAGDAVYHIGSSSNAFLGSYAYSSANSALRYDGVGAGNVIRFSTGVGIGDGAFFNTGSASNTIDASVMHGRDYPGVALSRASNIRVTRSTVTSADPGSNAMDVWRSPDLLVSESYIHNPVGQGLWIYGDSTRASVVNSTLSANSNGSALYLYDASSVTVSGSRIVNAVQYGLFMGPVGLATITGSTIAGAEFGLYLYETSSNTITDSYIQGSTAAYVEGSTGTVLQRNVFAATDASRSALVADRFVNLTLASSTMRGGAQGAGVVLRNYGRGAVAIGSVTVSGAARGIEVSTQAAGFSLNVDSVTFRGLASGATAIHFLGGSFTSVIQLASFEDTSVGANVSGAALDLSSLITMRAHYGDRTGTPFENDPNGLVYWEGESGAPYPGCVETRNVGSGQQFATISLGVAALPTSLTGHSCVVIRDAATYAEQVKVEGFTMNNSTISIFTDPAVGARATVAPNTTASTAAFVIANSSVNLSNLIVRPSAAVQFGVSASSELVRISSVMVDGAGLLWGAGVKLSSWSALSYSSVAVGNSHGVWLSGALRSELSFSTVVAASSGRNALFLEGSDTNTVTASYFFNSNKETVMLAGGSDSNVISLSTVVSAAAGSPAVSLVSADSNTVTTSFISNTGGGHGVHLNTGSDYNAFSASTITATSGNAFYAIGGSLGSSVTDSYLQSATGIAAQLNNAPGGTLSQSTMTSAGTWTVLIQNTRNSSITGSFIRATVGGQALRYDSHSDSNTVTQSTITAVTNVALYINNSASNTVVDSYLASQSGSGIDLNSTSTGTVFYRSSVSAGAGFALAMVNVSSTSMIDSVFSGPTALNIAASTGATAAGSTFIATAAGGHGIVLSAGSVNLYLATSTVRGGASGDGLVVPAGTDGLIRVGSVTFSGSARGIVVSTGAAGFALAVDSVTFRSLSSGATAIHFLGGTFVSTITAAAFEASNVNLANVSGAALDLASRITMRGSKGPKDGPDFENDPNSLVDWADMVPPSSVSLWFVGMSSAALQYGTVGATGYTVQASTRADFAAWVRVSSTVFGTQDRLTTLPLMPNSTYFLRAGALWGGTTVYAQTVVSTSTLANLVTGTTVYSIHLTSMAVNWVPLALSPPDASSKTAQGYVLQASSMSTFAPLWSSSFTPNVALSTLTIDTLRGGVTYYFRVGALNHNSVPNWAPYVSTLMPVQLGVELTTHTISVPGLVNLNSTVLITTSVIVTNTGNVKETYWVRATTVTPGSPWTIGTSQGVDRYVLSMLINPAEPVVGNFGVEDKLLDDEKDCTATVFAFGGNCVQVPVGGTRTLWFKLDTPVVTSTGASQDLRIYVRAARDPDPDPNP